MTHRAYLDASTTTVPPERHVNGSINGEPDEPVYIVVLNAPQHSKFTPVFLENGNSHLILSCQHWFVQINEVSLRFGFWEEDWLRRDTSGSSCGGWVALKRSRRMHLTLSFPFCNRLEHCMRNQPLIIQSEFFVFSGFEDEISSNSCSCTAHNYYHSHDDNNIKVINEEVDRTALPSVSAFRTGLWNLAGVSIPD